MKRQCDQCNRPATHHSVEILKGQKIEQHLCDQHATEKGLSVAATHLPINELLTNFVKLHSGTTAAAKSNQQACESCGLTFGQFREHTLLGCPDCYTAFEPQLSPLLERAHEGGTSHVGKIPRRAGSGQARQEQLMQLRGRLNDAVEREDYELAARLRDGIDRLGEDVQSHEAKEGEEGGRS